MNKWIKVGLGVLAGAVGTGMVVKALSKKNEDTEEECSEEVEESEADED